MKTLVIAPQPFFSPRGTPLSVYYRTKMLSDLGHEVDLLTYPIGQDVKIENVNIIRSPGVPFVYDVKIGPSFAKLVLDIPLFIHAILLIIKNRYDFIHAHEEAVFFCLLVKFLFNKPYLYDMHSSLPQQLENFNFTKLKAIVKIFEYLERISISKASSIITICNELEEQVGRYGYSEKNELIQNTLFFPVAFSDDACTVELKNIINTKDKAIVLYAGTFEPYQGLDMYLESIKIILKQTKDLMFVFLGGKSEQVLEMRKRAEELHISENTIFTGLLEVNLVKEFIKEAHALVSPRSKGTNTPLKIYEYMASGIPIIATNLKTHTQELDEDCAFLTNPDPEGFANGVLECFKNREEGKRRARNAYRRYTMKYGETIYKKKLESVLERVNGFVPN
jgi:glycosyltransferase involved in cell wall biosynthesis